MKNFAVIIEYSNSIRERKEELVRKDERGLDKEKWQPARLPFLYLLLWCPTIFRTVVKSYTLTPKVVGIWLKNKFYIIKLVYLSWIVVSYISKLILIYGVVMKENLKAIR